MEFSETQYFFLRGRCRCCVAAERCADQCSLLTSAHSSSHRHLYVGTSAVIPRSYTSMFSLVIRPYARTPCCQVTRPRFDVRIPYQLTPSALCTIPHAPLHSRWPEPRRNTTWTFSGYLVFVYALFGIFYVQRAGRTSDRGLVLVTSCRVLAS